MLSVPYFVWMQCQGELTLQQSYLRQLLFLYFDNAASAHHKELKSAGKSTDNSNASTDDDEACGAIFDNP